MGVGRGGRGTKKIMQGKVPGKRFMQGGIQRKIIMQMDGVFKLLVLLILSLKGPKKVILVSKKI